MASIIINWGTPNVVDSVYPSSTYVYGLTADGFTAKHTGSSPWTYRKLIINDSDFIPPGNKIVKAKITTSFYGDTDHGDFRVHKPSATSGTDYLFRLGVYTYQRTESCEIDADDLSVGDGQHGVILGYYYNSFSTCYCYFSGIQVELIYEADATKIFLGETPVTSAYIGNTKLTGIYLGDTKIL